MSWKKVKLGDICTSISDGDHQAPPKVLDGVPFVTISNISDHNDIEFDGKTFVPQSYYDKLDSKRKAQTNDILYSVVGSYGIPVFINNNNAFSFQRHIAILRPNEECVNPRYLYYVMKSTAFYQMMDSVAIGAAQKTITLTTLRNAEVELPLRKTQNVIATILSNYDNLIVNYRKQIKLLEEAAQRLYKEWFVDMHFPGHETAKFNEDGLPEGWEKVTLGTLGEFKRGKTITKDSVAEGNVPVVAGGLGPAYYHNTSNTTNRVITVSGSGANAGFTRMYYQEIWASDCSFVDTDKTEHIHFMYCVLKANKAYIDNLQKGAAQPHVYAKDINALETNRQDEATLNQFEQKVKSMFDMVCNLNKQISSLEEARDRLLPKLMSGEIEV